MNTKALRIVQLVAGCLAAFVALFFLIEGILFLTDISGEEGTAKWNVYVIIAALLALAAATGLAIFGTYLILSFVRNQDGKKLAFFTLLTYLGYEVISTFITMCFFGFNQGLPWVVVVFGIGGAVVLLLSVLLNLDKVTSGVLGFVGCGLGFIVSTMCLSNTGGLDVATELFSMFTIIAVAVLFIFQFILEYNSKSE